MALTLYNIRKWARMFSGKSVMHVNQDLGKVFQVDKIAGYYNNLTEKVTMLSELLGTDKLPQYTTPSGKKEIFPVDVFQYGLGAYDLYLLKHDEVYLEKFRQCCEWTLAHQEDSGAWCNFFFKYPDNPYGAMAQGEAASLLIRGYKEYGREDYLNAAKKAIDFMLKPLSEGGTTEYKPNGDVILCEYTHLPVVLNGWIFALWGLRDFIVGTNDKGRYAEIYEKTEESMQRNLPVFSCSYWSMYNTAGEITSPFYHNLHIAQMQAMYKLTGHSVYNEFVERWQRYNASRICKYRALAKKAWQKINEKEAWSK